MTMLDTSPAVTRDGRPSVVSAGPAKPDDATCYRVISRAALFTTVVFTSMFVIMGGFIGFDQSVPQQDAKLLQAQRGSGVYRVFSTLDSMTILAAR
jgi:hypothetical protein